MKKTKKDKSIEPAEDFLSLKGSLKTNKKISGKIIKEKFARHISSLTFSGIK